MNPPKNEAELRVYLRALKEFYTNLLIYAVVCFLSLLVWLSMGGGVFWSIWVLLGCGINVALQAVQLDQIPHLRHYFPFLNSSWEQEQFDKTTDSLFSGTVHSDADGMVEESLSQDLVYKKQSPKKMPSKKQAEEL